MRLTRISPCLWFDSQAEDAARYYCSIFENSRIRAVSRYGDAGRAVHGRPAGSVLTVSVAWVSVPPTATVPSLVLPS